MADLSTIEYIEKTVRIVHPNNKEDLGIAVSLMSPEDPRLEPIKTKILDQQLKLQASNKTLKAEQIKHNRDMILFRAITGWEWTKDARGDAALWEGEKPELNQKNVLDIFAKHAWFRNQVDEAFSELESFFNDPATT